MAGAVAVVGPVASPTAGVARGVVDAPAGATCGSCGAALPSDGGSANTEKRRVKRRSQPALMDTSTIGSSTGVDAVIRTSQVFSPAPRSRSVRMAFGLSTLSP